MLGQTNIRKILRVVFIAAVTPFSGFSAEAELTAGEKNYIALREFYAGWQNGLFGSKNVRRKELYRFCLDLIGEEIASGVDFVFLYPPSVDGRFVASMLGGIEPPWLYIHGELDKAALAEAAKKPRTEQNCKRLFKIKGKVVQFRLDMNLSADNVDLWLENIFVY